MIKYFILMFSLTIFANDNYQSGTDYCKDIAPIEGGEWIQVPVSYASPNKGTFGLYYWFLGKKYDPLKPTIIRVDGGPGGTSHYYHSLLDEINKDYNIVFFDQRGYVCSRPNSFKDQSSLSFYSLENTARDMNEIRNAIQISTWSVYGSSFGTPISLKYSEMFAKNTTSTVIDGPAGIHFFEQSKVDSFSKNPALKSWDESIFKDYSLPEDLFEKYEELIYAFTNNFGYKGLAIIHDAVKKQLKVPFTLDKIKASIENLYLDFDEGSLYEDAYYNFEKIYSARGKHVFEGAINYVWEPSWTTELITSNDEFGCIYDYEDFDCSINSTAFNKTLNIGNLELKSPVYFFQGYFDGYFDDLLFINNVYKSKGVRSYVVKMNQNSHGPLYDTAMFGSLIEKSKIKEVLIKAFKGNHLAQDDFDEYNSDGNYTAEVY